VRRSVKSGRPPPHPPRPGPFPRCGRRLGWRARRPRRGLGDRRARAYAAFPRRHPGRRREELTDAEAANQRITVAPVSRQSDAERSAPS
jgi:hypothetical protein